MTARIQQPSSRKRRAPFSQEDFQDTRNSPSPRLTQLPLQQSNQSSNNLPIYNGEPSVGGTPYGYNNNMSTNTPASPSTQILARRQHDNQMRTMSALNSNNAVDFQGQTEYGQATRPSEDQWQAPYNDLDQRAAIAQRDALSKRKQIPPFVQKLSR